MRICYANVRYFTSIVQLALGILCWTTACGGKYTIGKLGAGEEKIRLTNINPEEVPKREDGDDKTNETDQRLRTRSGEGDVAPIQRQPVGVNTRGSNEEYLLERADGCTLCFLVVCCHPALCCHLGRYSTYNALAIVLGHQEVSTKCPRGNLL